jgi:UDPglucose--hexose-1-phosphate uridylyltransferase
MPELRRDPISNTWVIIAEDRGRRPSDFFVDRAQQGGAEGCPFCNGNEHLTPKETYALRDNSEADSPNWDVRVVPNKFPAMAPHGKLDPQQLGPLQSMNGIGHHEVIIDSPDHMQTLADLPDAQVLKVVNTYIERIKALYETETCTYAQLFKNDGREAGASLAHPHTQLVGVPLLPTAIETEIRNALAYFSTEQHNLFESILELTMNDQSRIVEQQVDFIAFTPFASRFPFEVHLYPRFNSHDFTALDVDQQRGFAQILKSTLSRLKAKLNNPPYNFYLHTSPNPLKTESVGLKDAFRWHLGIVPRLSIIAGFEMGSGVYINPTSPELAAELLRN